MKVKMELLIVSQLQASPFPSPQSHKPKAFERLSQQLVLALIL